MNISADDAAMIGGALSLCFMAVMMVIGVMFVWGQGEKGPE